VTPRVSPTHALRAEIDSLFAGGRDLVEVLEDVARLGARMIIQTAVEAEVEAFLGRARYQRAATADQVLRDVRCVDDGVIGFDAGQRREGPVRRSRTGPGVHVVAVVLTLS